MKSLLKFASKYPSKLTLITKLLVTFLAFVFVSEAQAIVKIQFFGMQTMVNVIGHDRLGGSDSDPVDIFNLMNVPIQHTLMGPGKSIVTADRKFNLVCAVQGGENKCSLIVQLSPETQADPINKVLTYDLGGDGARKLVQQFYLNKAQAIHFVSADKQLSLDVTEDHFRLHFQGNGQN